MVFRPYGKTRNRVYRTGNSAGETAAVVGIFAAILLGILVKLAVVGFVLWLAYTLVMGLVG